MASKEEEALTEEIKNLVASLSISDRKVILNIPRHLVTVRFLRLPSTKPDEIGKMIKVESLKHVPYADEDIIAGWRVVESFEDGYSNVLLAIVQAATVNRLLRILKRAGLTTESVALGSEALYLWYLVSIPEGEESRKVLLADIDPHYVNIAVIEGRKIVFTRGAICDSKEKAAGSAVTHQIRISMATYQKESSATIEKVVLTGADDNVMAIRDLLGKELAIPTDVMGQTENIPLADKAEIDSKDASFTELLGLVMRPEGIKVNLMPEDLVEAKRVNAIQKNVTISAVLSLLVLSMIFILVVKKLYDKAVYLSYINFELKKMSPQVAGAKKMLKEIAIVRDQVRKKPYSVDIVTEIHKITPDGISLNFMDFESGKSVILRGNTSALSDVFKYVSILEKSPYFNGAKVRYATKRVTSKAEIIDFEIKCELSAIK